MTVRVPLKLHGSNLKEMTAAEVAVDVNRAAYLYGGSQSIVLSLVNSGGNLANGSIADTRLQAGISTSDATNFHTAGETGNVSTITTFYTRLFETRNNVSNTPDTNNVRFPVYYDGVNVRAMSLTDFRDTFIKPAVDQLTNTSDAYGKYRIHSGISLSNHTLVSSSNVYTDTRANVGLYSAAGIAETRDQPTSVTNYYLFRGNSNLTSNTVGTANIMFTNTSGNLQAFSQANWDALLLTDTRYVAKALSGSTLKYILGTTTVGKRGSGMTDTKFNSSSYNQRFVNTNDYRTQEFPAGSAVSISTKYLRLIQQ